MKATLCPKWFHVNVGSQFVYHSIPHTENGRTVGRLNVLMILHDIDVISEMVRQWEG